MKYEVTYKEMSEIFGSIAKAQAKITEAKVARNIYVEMSDNYNAEASLKNALNMQDAYGDMIKKEKAVVAEFKKLAKLMGLKKEDGYEDANILLLIKSVYRMDSAMYAIECYTKRLFQYVA